jgi:mono/diheme cytochrome c family protein
LKAWLERALDHVRTVAPKPAAQEAALPGKFYRIVDGKVDPRTYNGYRRYHAVCNHCHGPDGMGSSFGPSLVDHLLPNASPVARFPPF